LDQVIEYCRPLPPYEHSARRSSLGTGVLSRFLIASGLALCLQWSTAGAAIVIVWFTPTTGTSFDSLCTFAHNNPQVWDAVLELT
jgi:hypothetical protein